MAEHSGPDGALTVTATMLIGIDRFVADDADGMPVMCADHQVQPWLCAEALLGAGLWALCVDGAIDLRPGAGRVEVIPLRGFGYPATSLEYRLAATLGEGREPVTAVLTRLLAAAKAWPWLDVIDVVCGELVHAGLLAERPFAHNGNGSPPATAIVLADCERVTELGPAVDELIVRWDAWWARREVMLTALARACHDAIAAHRRRFADRVVIGFPLAGDCPDPAESSAASARARCPRWARRI